MRKSIFGTIPFFFKIIAEIGRVLLLRNNFLHCQLPHIEKFISPQHPRQFPLFGVEGQ